MVKKHRVVNGLLLSVFLLLAGCGGGQADPQALPEVINVYATQAAQPWLEGMVACAHAHDAVIRLVDPAQAQVTLQVGEPLFLEGAAYQVGQEEIMLALNPQNPAAFISQAQAAALFSGSLANWQEVTGVDAPVQVWVFPARADVGQAFNNWLLGGRSPVSTARMAAGREELRAEIARDVNAIGYIGRLSAGADLRLVPLENPLLLPVLAITVAPPQGLLRDVLACTQQSTAP